MIHYEVSAENPAAHLFNIQMQIPKGSPNGLKVSMPNWIPGSYLIRDFARHIVSIEAFRGIADKLSKMVLEKIDSNTWLCENESGPITLKYTVYAWDLSVRGAHLDETHAFFNPCSLFLQVVGQESSACKVTIVPPNCAAASQWRVATTLTREDAKAWGYGSYIASTYDELIDHPVEIGNFDVVEFIVANVPHTIVVSGKHDGDLNRLAKDVSKICQAHIELFNKAPFERYLFLLTVLKDGYGGLEHRSSTALIAQRDALPILNDASMSRNYINLLALFSHEYFHAWNVKRIKPLAFAPYNLNQKCYTKQLWAFEGITSYYDELALLRAKVITIEQYLDLVAQTLTKVLRNPGRKKQTLTESSFDAWTKFYIPNENSNNAGVSYYLKGTIVALAFDLALRNQTQHKTSLDSIMRMLWSEFGEKNIGVPEGLIEEMIALSGDEKIKQLIHLALYTTQDIPLQPLLEPFGLQLTLRQAQSSEDIGGKKITQPSLENDAFKQGYFGCTFSKNQSRLIVSGVLDDSAAMLAGISAQDELVAIDGIRTDAESFDKIAKRLKVGQQISVHVFRQDVLTEKKVTLKAPAQDTAQITIKENLTHEQKNNLDRWLS